MSLTRFVLPDGRCLDVNLKNLWAIEYKDDGGATLYLGGMGEANALRVRQVLLWKDMTVDENYRHPFPVTEENLADELDDSGIVRIANKIDEDDVEIPLAITGPYGCYAEPLPIATREDDIIEIHGDINTYQPE